MHTVDKKCMAVIDYVRFCRSLRKVAKRYGVSKSSLQRWVSNYIKGDGLCRRVINRKAKVRAIEKTVVTAVNQNPFVTTGELVDLLREIGYRVCSQSTVCRTIRRTGYTRKVSSFVSDAKSQHPDRFEALQRYFKHNLHDIVSIDETCVYLGQSKRKGYAQRGRRLALTRDKPPRQRKLSLIMATTTRGVLGHCIVDGNVNGKKFCDFLKSLPLQNSSVLLVDNAAYHRTSDVREVVQQKGCSILYNLPYSPEFNPIEMTFNQLKSRFSKHRNFELALSQVQPLHALNTFLHVQKLLGG